MHQRPKTECTASPRRSARDGKAPCGTCAALLTFRLALQREALRLRRLHRLLHQLGTIPLPLVLRLGTQLLWAGGRRSVGKLVTSRPRVDCQLKPKSDTAPRSSCRQASCAAAAAMPTPPRTIMYCQSICGADSHSCTPASFWACAAGWTRPAVHVSMAGCCLHGLSHTLPAAAAAANGRKPTLVTAYLDRRKQGIVVFGSQHRSGQ